MDLYHLYSLFRMIYEEVTHNFSNAKVDLSYNEGNSEHLALTEGNSEHLALTVKFAADIEPSESSKYCEEVY